MPWNRKPWYWALLALTLLAASVFTLVPELDLWASGLFHQPEVGFPFNRTALGRFVVKGVPPIINGAVVYVIILWLAGLFFRRSLLGITGRITGFLCLSLALGPGLIVNGLLKEYWGRARPAHTTLFGGEANFTPALLPTDQCLENCSFAGGHAAHAFWVMAFALLVPPPWRRWAVGAALLFGTLVGLARIAQGKHFLSDILFAAIISLSVVLFLHDRLISRRSGPAIPPRSGS